MCQAFPGTFKSYPCAATVADFKVNGDGTTCINYQPVNYEGYIRFVSQFRDRKGGVGGGEGCW